MTMDLNAKINSVKNYLEAQYMFADDEWIAGLVEFLAMPIGTIYTINEIQTLAREQWLLNDLEDICPGSLPINLKTQEKTVLNGKYILQINSALDVGTAGYQQYLKLQKVNMENVEATANYEDRVENHRMIKLQLTDGAQDVKGIEYRPMRNISGDVTPGSKMLLKGPVECRNGILLLTESCIELLGGEVENLVIGNKLAKMLASTLKLPYTEPKANNPTTTTSHATAPHTDMPPRSEVPPRSQLPPRSEMPSWADMPLRLEMYPTTSIEQPTRPVARVTSLQVSNFNDDDDDVDFDQLAAIEAEICDTNCKNNSTNTKTSTTNTKDNVASDKYLLNVASNSDLMRNDTQSCKRISDHEIDAVPDKRVKIDNLSGYPDEEDMFCEEDYLREIEQDINTKEMIKYPINISKEPYTYIKHINEMTDSEKAGKSFKIKAQIMKLISKLVVSKEGWSLKCLLIDGTGELEVEFTSDVLSKLVGFTPTQMSKMKKDMVHNPELKKTVMAALYKAKESLQVLYCIIEITILETPKITQLIPFEYSHEMQQKKRFENTGID